MLSKREISLFLVAGMFLSVAVSLGKPVLAQNGIGDYRSALNQTLTIQGYAVDENLNAIPANLVKIEITKQGTQEGQISENNNPYFFRNLSVANYSVKTNIPNGYDLLGYTMCYDKTDCHNDKPKAGSLAGVYPSRSTGVVDLWWHLKKKNNQNDQGSSISMSDLKVIPSTVMADKNFTVSANVEVMNSNFASCQVIYKKDNENDWHSPYGGYMDVCTGKPKFEFQLPEGIYDIKIIAKNDKGQSIEKSSVVYVKSGSVQPQQCLDLNFVGGGFSPKAVNVNQEFKVSCDYGKSGTDGIAPEILPNNGTSKCSFLGFADTSATFSCIAPKTNGEYEVVCNLKAKGNMNVCKARKDTLFGKLNVTGGQDSTQKHKFAISESLRDYNTGAFISDMSSTFEISCADGFKQTANFAAGAQRIRDVIENNGKCTVKFNNTNTNYVYRGYRKITCLNSCGSDDKSGASQKLNSSKSVSLNAKVDGTQEYIIDWYLEKKTNTVACAKEGQSITYGGGDTGKRCCEGLKEIDPKTISSKCKTQPEKCLTGTWKKICTAKCGNGTCDKNTESSSNCPTDCGLDEVEKISYKLIGDVRDANNIKKTINKKMLKMKLVCGEKEYFLKKGNQDMYSNFNFKINQNLGQQCTLMNMGGFVGYRYRGYTICENEDIPGCHADQDMIESSNIDMGALDIADKDKIQVRWYFEKLE